MHYYMVYLIPYSLRTLRLSFSVCEYLISDLQSALQSQTNRIVVSKSGISYDTICTFDF